MSQHHNSCLMKRHPSATASPMTWHLSLASPAPPSSTRLVHIPPLPLRFFIPLAVATEWCDSREQTMSGYPGNLGKGRTEASRGPTASLPPLQSGARLVPPMIHRAARPRLATPIWVRLGEGEAREKEADEEGGRIIRGRGRLCLRQWHSLIGRCPCRWHA